MLISIRRVVPVMRVAGDAERPLPPDLAQDGVGGLIGADVSLDVERDDVRVLLAAQAVLRHLRAGNDEHAVLLQARSASVLMSARYASNVVFAHAEAPLPERRDAAGAREQVLLHQNVVGDGDDVELAGLAVEIDDLANRQPAVAPLRVDVKVAEQKGLVSRHSGPHVQVHRVLRPMVQDLRDEVPDVEPEDLALPHRDVPARGRVEIAVVEQADLADDEEPAAKVRVFAMKLDRRVETANQLERLAANREVAAVEDGPDSEDVLARAAA